MPICTHGGLSKHATSNDKATFQDHEEVFYCETTRQIFRDYEEYFCHVMAVNSNIWRCEVTGKENLTYEEAMRSERNARRKLELFKEILRPPTLLLIQRAQQSSLRTLSALTYRFLRSRFFRNEEVQVYQRTPSISSSYHYVITDIIWPYSQPPSNGIYTEPEKLRYRLRCLQENSNVGESLVVPFAKLRRKRSGISWENIYMFLKNHTIRVNGIIQPHPDAMKKYILDPGLTFEQMFIGKMLEFPSPKGRIRNNNSSINVNGLNVTTNQKGGGDVRKQTNINEFLVSPINQRIKQTTAATTIRTGRGGGVVTSTTIKQSKLSMQSNGEINNMKKNIMEKKRAEELAREKSLKEEMERVRQQKLQQMMEEERLRMEKRERLLAKVELQCNALLLVTDDLERTDQRPLPIYNPVRTYIPQKYLSEAFELREFLHSYKGILSGIEVFRNNISFYELSRAFTVREVAGPLSDILCILMGTIFDLQREEEEECAVEYVSGSGTSLTNGIREPYLTMTLAARSHHYCKRHFASKLNELPVDALTLSEVIRLHLLSSGALVRNRRAEKWRLMYRNGYTSLEDPGLELRTQYPHILKALKMYTIYELPYRDIIRIIRCLVDQLLTYSSTINVLEERLEQMSATRLELKNLMLMENQRLTKLQAEKRAFTQEFHQQSAELKRKIDKEKRQELEEKYNQRVAELMSNSERELKKHQQQVAKVHGTLFNQLVCLGMDRAYRKYYIWETFPGLFIEHPKECYDRCFTDPPKNDPNSLRLQANAEKLPQNRKDLRTYLMKLYQEEEVGKEKEKEEDDNDEMKIPTTVQMFKIDKDDKVTTGNHQENKEEIRLNGQLLSHHHNNNNQLKQNSSTEDKMNLVNNNSTTNNVTSIIKDESGEKNGTNNDDDDDNGSNNVHHHYPTQYELYMCTGDPKKCLVHSDDDNNNNNNNPVDRQIWSFIHEKRDLDALIESLNPLGSRESKLRAQLITYKELLVKHIRYCPVDMLNLESRQMSKFKRSMILDTHRKYQNANFGVVGDKIDLNDVMFAALSSRILQFEKELYTGSLGLLKIKNMEKWRRDLENGSYDPQGKIIWGGLSSSSSLSLSLDMENSEQRRQRQRSSSEEEGVGNRRRRNTVTMENDGETNGVVDAEEMTAYTDKAYHDPGDQLTENQKIDSEEGNSSDDDNISLHNSEIHRNSVKQLASALLQVEQAVERRFLKEPFGIALLKDREQQERKQQLANNRLQQWEISLMESTSFSQIFLHLNVLHDSIVWSRSTNKSNCMVCRRGTEPDKLLLCDECNGGTHLFCMKPKMESVPDGNWYCKRCVKEFGLKNENTEQETKLRKQVKEKRAFLIDEENSDASSVNSSDTKRTRSGMMMGRGGGGGGVQGAAAAAVTLPSSLAGRSRRSKRRLLTQGISMELESVTENVENEDREDDDGEENQEENDSNDDDEDNDLESRTNKEEDDDDDEEEEEEEEKDEDNNHHDNGSIINGVEEAEAAADELLEQAEEDEEMEDGDDDDQQYGGESDESDDAVEDNDDQSSSNDDSDYVNNSNVRSKLRKGKPEIRNTFEVKLKSLRGGNNKRRRGLRNTNESDNSEEEEESDDDGQKFATPAKRARRSTTIGSGRRSGGGGGGELAAASRRRRSGGGGGGGRVSSRRSLRHSNTNLPLDNKVLHELLARIMKEENAWPFLRPVSQAEVPDYYNIIKQPMDFAKIKSNLNVGAYGNNSEVLHDIELIFHNCDRYNVIGDEIYKAGCALEKCIVDWCDELKLPFQPSDMNVTD